MMSSSAPPIVLPAPTFRDATGRLDLSASRQYAEYVASTWIERVVVAGPMGAGEHASRSERAALAQLWAEHLPREALFVACWTLDEVGLVLDGGMRPLVMLRADADAELIELLDVVPADVVAYTNPRYSRAVITADVIRRVEHLPAGLKLSKVSLDELAAVRAAVGDGVQLTHGSSRDIAGSLAAGADLVVTSPLATLPEPWPATDVHSVQAAVDEVQVVLDRSPDHAARVDAVAAIARARMTASMTASLSVNHAKEDHSTYGATR